MAKRGELSRGDWKRDLEQITLEGAATGDGLNDSNDLPEGDERREQITGGTGGGTSTRQGGEPRRMREALLPIVGV